MICPNQPVILSLGLMKLGPTSAWSILPSTRWPLLWSPEQRPQGPAPTTCLQVLLPMVVPRMHPLPCFLPPSLYIMSLYASYLAHTHMPTLTELPSSPPGQGSLSSHFGSSGLEPTTKGPNTCFCKPTTGSSIYHPGKRISFFKKNFLCESPPMYLRPH